MKYKIVKFVAAGIIQGETESLLGITEEGYSCIVDFIGEELVIGSPYDFYWDYWVIGDITEEEKEYAEKILKNPKEIKYTYRYDVYGEGPYVTMSTKEAIKNYEQLFKESVRKRTPNDYKGIIKNK